MLLLRHRQHANQAWNPHGASADQRLLEGHGRALGIEKQVGLGCSGCSLASVKGLGFFAIKVQQKAATADAAALGLYNAQDHLHGNRCVQRAAAGPQDLVTCLGRQRIGRRDSEFAGLERCFLHTGAGEFGLHRQTALRVGSAEPDKKCCEQGSVPKRPVRYGTQGAHFLQHVLPKAGFDC